MSVFASHREALKTTENIKSFDGCKLHHHYTPHGTSQTLMVLVHGFTEHSGRYDHVVSTLSQSHQVLIYDQRGHGHSEGPRNHVDHFLDYVKDLQHVISFTRQNYSFRQLILIGHSMGGQVVINHLVHYPNEDIRAFILTSPNIRVAVPIPKLKKNLGYWAAHKFPKFRLPSSISPKLLTHDVEKVRSYKRDPAIQTHITVKLAQEMLDNQETLIEKAQQISVPALVLQAADDKICDPRAAKEFFEKLSSNHKNFINYEGFYHEIFHELEWKKVTDDVLHWAQGL